jgi:hypothetical protein
MIAAANLSYTYASARRAVGTGEIVGFLGTNSAGKSAPQGSSRTIRDVAWQAVRY